ncbi:MAG: hypothetical protein AAGH89_10705, partial [Verrucomicrobiota bacterium]
PNNWRDLGGNFATIHRTPRPDLCPHVIESILNRNRSEWLDGFVSSRNCLRHFVRRFDWGRSSCIHPEKADWRR